MDAGGSRVICIPEREAGRLPLLPANRLLEQVLWLQHCLLLQRGLPES